METRDSGDYDKQQWQESTAAHDAAWDKQREKEAKARERSARNAKRKLERLHAKLKETGDLTEWEGDFAVSVTERLDEFGSAFADLQKGRPGDALSFAQKRVVASLNKKVKDARKAAKAKAMGLDKGEDGNSDDEPERSIYKPRSSFKSKKPKFTPRVRNIEDDFEDEAEEPPRPVRHQPFIPRYVSEVAEDVSSIRAKPIRVIPIAKPAPAQAEIPKAESLHDDADRPPVGRPFLRIVKSG